MIEFHRWRWAEVGPCIACGRPTSRWFRFLTDQGGLHAHCILRRSA